jgi:hypothetical protein
MAACLLLDPFEVYLEMSVVFVLSICVATANSCGVENCLLKGWNFNMKVRRQVPAENMKICSYFHIRNIPNQQDVS